MYTSMACVNSTIEGNVTVQTTAASETDSTYCEYILEPGLLPAHVHVLMRNEKEGRKKQTKSNKQGKET